jgi:hypothetical protein
MAMTIMNAMMPMLDGLGDGSNASCDPVVAMGGDDEPDCGDELICGDGGAGVGAGGVACAGASYGGTFDVVMFACGSSARVRSSG